MAECINNLITSRSHLYQLRYVLRNIKRLICLNRLLDFQLCFSLINSIRFDLRYMHVGGEGVGGSRIKKGIIKLPSL